MPDYERSTASTTVAGLPEPLREAVLKRAETSQLTLASQAPAYLTHSRRLRRPGLFGRLTGTADKDVEHLTALVLGAKDVLVVTHGEHRGTAVLAARLEDVDVGSIADRLSLNGAGGASAADSGVTITGFPVNVDGGTGRGSYFVGLGAPDGDAARAALDEAVRNAKA